MRVNFFPLSELPVTVCNHRYNADMTYTEQTDSIFSTSRYAVEYYAHKHNARVGAFVNGLTQANHTDLVESQKYGSCKFDIYFPTDYWCNPVTGKIEVMPDFYATAWTELGAQYFNVEVGSAKTNRMPTHGEQMYNLSGGKYGFLTDGTIGQSRCSELILLHKNVIEWFYQVFGFVPVSMSYRNGVQTGRFMDILFYLQNRNSAATHPLSGKDSETWYGKSYEGEYLGYPNKDITRTLMMSRPSSFRWWDAIDNTAPLATKQQSLNYVADQIEKTIINHGWLNNFTHWHSAKSTTKEDIQIDSYDDYFSTIKTALGVNKAHFASYGEASEYLYHRTNLKNIAAYKQGNVIKVVTHVEDTFQNERINVVFDGRTPKSRIKTPLSVIVDLTGTFLENKNVITNYK